MINMLVLRITKGVYYKVVNQISVKNLQSNQIKHRYD